MELDFGNRLRSVRQVKGLRRGDIARKSGLAVGVYGRYERGECLPTVDTVRAIADALGVSLDYLIGDAPEPMRDRDMIARIEAIAKLTPERRSTLLDELDAYVRGAKTAKAYAA